MKILVINLMYIGDLLFATPALRALRHAFPAARIEMLIDRVYLDLVALNPHLDRVIAIDKKGYHNKARYLLGLIRTLRRERYDLAVNLHPNERASAITVLSGARRKCGLAARGFRRFFDAVVVPRSRGHQVEIYLEVAAALGAPVDEPGGLEMIVSEEARRTTDRIWCAEGLTDRAVVGLNPGGSWPAKRWTVEGFAGLAEMLEARSFRPVFFGGPMDVALVAEILSHMETKPTVLTGRLSLMELAAAIARCAAFISGDSGPMQIAAAQGVPVVAIFGPSSAARYAPYGVRHVVVRSDEPCLACGLHECAHHRCMTSVTAAQVWRELAGVMQAGAKGAGKPDIH